MGVFKFCIVELWNWVSNEILVQHFSVSLKCYYASKIRRESLHLMCSVLLWPKNYEVLNVMHIWGNFKTFHNVGALILALENTPSLNLLWMVWKITIWTGGQFAICLVESESWTTSWRNENKQQSQAQAHISFHTLASDDWGTAIEEPIPPSNSLLFWVQMYVLVL